MYNIGIDLGGTNIKVGVVNDDFKIVGKSNKRQTCPVLPKKSQTA